MITLRMWHDKMPNADRVGVFDGDKLVATVHPGDDSIRVESRYLGIVRREDDRPPSVSIHFTREAVTTRGQRERDLARLLHEHAGEIVTSAKLLRLFKYSPQTKVRYTTLATRGRIRPLGEGMWKIPNIEP